MDADAHMPGGHRRQPSRDVSRRDRAGAAAPGARRPSARTRSTASISFAPSHAPTTRRTLFDHTAEESRAVRAASRRRARHHRRDRPLRQLGNGQLPDARDRGRTLTIIAMAEASPDVNRIRNSIRERLGAETLEVRQSLDTALQIRRRLGDNQMVALLMDRHLGRDRVAVTLLGRHAWFLRTPALMSYLTGAPLLPCFINRVGPGRFAVHLGDPIRVSRDSSTRRRHPARRPAVRRSTRRTPAKASRALVSLLPVLGRAARFLRRTRLTACADGPAIARHLRPDADRARSARPLRSRRDRRGGTRRTRT